MTLLTELWLVLGVASAFVAAVLYVTLALLIGRIRAVEGRLQVLELQSPSRPDSWAPPGSGLLAWGRAICLVLALLTVLSLALHLVQFLRYH